jgi:hypothetical protein
MTARAFVEAEGPGRRNVSRGVQSRPLPVPQSRPWSTDLRRRRVAPARGHLRAQPGVARLMRRHGLAERCKRRWSTVTVPGGP